jgi:hypothetical protein
MNSKHWIVAVGIVAGVAGAALAEEQHPRLLVTPARLAVIRQQAAIKDSHHQQALTQLKASLDKVEEGDEETKGYGQGYRAVENAFLSAVVEDPAEKKKYADAAYKWIAGWTKTGSATLGKSMEAKCIALAYDWAYPVWTEEQRKQVRARVAAAAAALEQVTHSNLGGDRTSNFVGVIRGAELLARLALGTDVKDARVQFLAGELKTHFQNAWGDLGVTQEGGNYTEYPAGFSVPAALALKELGDPALFEEAIKHEHWKLMMYSRSFQPQYNHSIAWGVGHGSNNSEGLASLILAMCPPDQLPYYLWFYDRHMGRLAVGQPQHRFDSDRGTTAWALLLYPTELKAKDPTGVFPTAVADKKRGYVFYRNRWQDADDVIGGIFAQHHKDGKGWSQPEQLAMGLLGFGSRFMGGCAKNSPVQFSSTLLVDGKYDYKNATDRMGKLVAFEPTKTGVYVIVQGGQMFEKLGAKEAVRHLLVEFLPDGSALIATLDRLKGDKEHTYTWQANVGHVEALDWVPKWAPGAPPVDAADNIKISSATEAGRPSFLLQGRSGFAKGWAVAPADTTLKAADPLQISAKAIDTDILVVMWLAKGNPPAATIKGDGLGSSVSVAGKTVRFDASKGRLVLQ